MRVAVDSYSYHRLLGELTTGEPDTAERRRGLALASEKQGDRDEEDALIADRVVALLRRTLSSEARGQPALSGSPA